MADLSPLAGEAGLGARALLAQGLKLGDGFEVFHPACSPFDTDEAIQAQALALEPEHGKRLAVGKQIFVVAAASDFAEEVEITQGGRQGEVETPVKRLRVPAKRQSGRGTARIGRIGGECRSEAGDVVGSAPVGDVEILRQAGGAMGNCGHTADDDEFDLRLAEDLEKRLKIDHGRSAGRPF